jgi:hypothetical protein
LPPRYAVDAHGFEGYIPVGRRDAQKLPSIVGDVYSEARHHLVSFGYLLLDEDPVVGKGVSILGDRLLVAFAAGLLVGKPFTVADEVGSQHLVQRV